MIDKQEMMIGPMEFKKLRHWTIRSVQFAFILCLCGWGIFVAQSLLFDKKPGSAAAAAPVVQAWTPPEGYTAALTQEDIAYGHRFLKADEYKCILFQRCIGVAVIMSKDCPESLSISADLLNKAGEKVSTTTGIVQLVTAKEKTRVLLTLDSTEAVSARITMAMCH